MEEKKEKLVDFFIDPELVDRKGLVINEKRYIGKVKVTQDQADDMQRMISEYQETQRRLHDPSQKIRIKNSMIIEELFLADPKTRGNEKGFSKDFGLLDPWQWQFVNENHKKYLQEQKKALYGY